MTSQMKRCLLLTMCLSGVAGAGADPCWPTADSKDTQLSPAEAASPLKVGQRVLLATDIRTLWPCETGHARAVHGASGATGTVARFVRRTDRHGSVDLVIVRFDAQRWVEWKSPLDELEDGETVSAEKLIQRAADRAVIVSLRAFEVAMPVSFSRGWLAAVPVRKQ
jgi:hypothetical protein